MDDDCDCRPPYADCPHPPPEPRFRRVEDVALPEAEWIPYPAHAQHDGRTIGCPGCAAVECPTCHAIGDQPHTEYCHRGRGWRHSVTPPDA